MHDMSCVYPSEEADEWSSRLRLSDPPPHIGRLVDAELLQQALGVRVDEQHGAVLGPQKSIRGSAIKELEERIKIALDVQYAARLAMHTELGPGDHLQHLFEGAEAAWKPKEGVGALRHHRFALVHRRHDMELAEAGVRDLF